ncbi:MAG: iron ABC transporter [Phycisphaerales bacterium]|nr:MAG: iron ABC transporter [Phycisphaerales bacterium]
MHWTSLDTSIVIVAALGAMACALLGSFLLLRRMSMMGDAISHAVLPGLVAAFLISGSRSAMAMLIGAAVVGILTAAFTQWVHQLGKVEESASMGVVFTALFAVGLVMIVRFADSVDLDPECVLYGAIELTPLDTVTLLGKPVARSAVVLAAVLLLDVAFVLAFYKELRISSFDPALATTLGIHARLMHYVLMTLVAMTTVACFESIGSILVIAMLIVPPAAAHLLTDRYGVLLLLSTLLGAASAGLGHLGAIWAPTWWGFEDTNTAGMMAVAAGLLFAAAVLFSPRHGIISRALQRLRLTLRITIEDVLGLLYRVEEQGLIIRPGAAIELLRRTTGSGWLGRLAMAELRRRRCIATMADGLRLTGAGRRAAASLIRSHRLWEAYTARHVALPTDHLHHSAERAEHFISRPMREALAGDLDGVRTDPQGRTIPNGGTALDPTKAGA